MTRRRRGIRRRPTEVVTIDTLVDVASAVDPDLWICESSVDLDVVLDDDGMHAFPTATVRCDAASVCLHDEDGQASHATGAEALAHIGADRVTDHAYGNHMEVLNDAAIAAHRRAY